MANKLGQYAPVYSRGFKVVQLLAAGFVIAAVLDITGFNDWATSSRSKRNSKDSCEECRKRCESAKTALEKLESKLDMPEDKPKIPSLKVKILLVPVGFRVLWALGASGVKGPRRTPRKAWGWGVKMFVGTTLVSMLIT